jgi:UDP-glucose 4-epimerase
LPVTIIRFFNTVGPRQVGQYGMVLPRFVASAMANKPLEVHGDGNQSRCFCDVRDVVSALPQVLADPACAGRVFNLGHDESIHILALAELVRDTLNSKSPIVMVPYDEAFGTGFDDLRDRRPDLSRIRAAIGFNPRIPLVQTIRDLAAELAGRASSPAVELTA